MVADFSRKPDTDVGVPVPIGPSLQEQLRPLLEEEQRLLQTYGSKHPEVLTVRKKIEVTRELFTRPAVAFSSPSDKADVDSAGISGDLVERHLQTLKQRLSQIKMSEQALAELYDTESREARKLTRFEIEDEAFRTDILRTQQLYEGIVKRLQEVHLVREVGGYDAKTLTPAGIGRQVSPQAKLIFPAAVFLGLLIGLGFAYFAEVTDRSFHTPEEISRRLGLPVMGYLPLMRPDPEARRQRELNGAALDPMICTYHKPRSPEAEAFRGVRTAIYFSTQGKGHKVIQITSPSEGHGKSTLAANLAVSIAQSGNRVLLIDADLRKPRLHKMFGIGPGAGLVSIIAGKAEIADAVKSTCVPELSLLPCGPVPANPSELLTSSRFSELLETIREQYDFVIVDTPPLLAASDSSVVAARADGVLLNIRLTKNGRPQAERSREMLHALGATVLGVVVTGGDARGGATQFLYGYEYGYGYHNGNGNGDDGNGRGRTRDAVEHKPAPARVESLPPTDGQKAS
jgi:capsular exopolysaccharide synthesis family protein